MQKIRAYLFISGNGLIGYLASIWDLACQDGSWPVPFFWVSSFSSGSVWWSRIMLPNKGLRNLLIPKKLKLLLSWKSKSKAMPKIYHPRTRKWPTWKSNWNQSTRKPRNLNLQPKEKKKKEIMCVLKNHHFSYVIIQIPWIFWNYLNFYLQQCISFSAPYRVSYYWHHILKLDTFENKETTLSYHSKCSAICFKSNCD